MPITTHTVRFIRWSPPLVDFGSIETIIPLRAIPSYVVLDISSGNEVGRIEVEGATWWQALVRDGTSLTPPWEAHIKWNFPPSIMKEEILRASSFTTRLDYYNSLQG